MSGIEVTHIQNKETGDHQLYYVCPKCREVVRAYITYREDQSQIDELVLLSKISIITEATRHQQRPCKAHELLDELASYKADKIGKVK